MNPNGISRAAVLVSIVFAISVFSLGLFVWVSFGGSVPFGAKGYEVKVRFGAEAANLFPNAQARISGVTVGRVKKVETIGGSVVATIELKSEYAPLHNGASAVLRSKTLLGEAFVELAPGAKSLPPIADGGSLNTENVTTAQGIDKALSVFDDRGRKDLKTFLTGLADATEGRGPDVNSALGNAPMTTDDLRDLVQVLNSQRPALQGLIRDMGTTFRTIGAHAGDTRQLASAGAQVFATTAARDKDLTATVKALPALMTELRSFAGQTIDISRAAAPAVKVLAPVASRLAPGLRSARALAPDLTATLRSLDRTNKVSVTGVPALSKILQEADPVLKVLDPAGRELVPVVRVLAQYAPDGVASMANTAAATNATFARATGPAKHYLRVLLQINNEATFGQTTRDGGHRENAYTAPGALQRLIDNEPLEAISCKDSGNATTPIVGSGAPPCIQAPAYSLAGGPAAIIPRLPADDAKP